MECSPFVQSYLVVAPPSASNLKYVVFYLGGASDFSQNELQPQDPCSPKDSAITDKINSIANGQVASINKNLDLAVKIAKTFNSGN
jgi:hypothetical protein